MSKNQKKVAFERGSDNVFSDLEMPDSEEKLAKAELAFKINELIKQKKLKQIDAAKLLGVDQAKISLLNKGRLSAFSMERLIKYLNILHQDIEIVVKPHGRAEGHLKVVYASL